MNTNDLPKHDAGLFLQHNEHKNYYEKPGAWLAGLLNQPTFQSEAARAVAIETDSIWTLQWYPRTPVGFNYIAAPTLEELLAWAKEIEKNEQ